ncbi:hypothetical protein E2C01_018833 [Portunus trituberculatus]|uniref:Uncharacterized protein n=1 Tax=Portunus trituberculatus TaxID=210409 RepID=A0A5B7DVQ1_PORTR|nr:hypothetical protein [Portunus trituberculatus]
MTLGESQRTAQYCWPRPRNKSVDVSVIGENCCNYWTAQDEGVTSVLFAIGCGLGGSRPGCHTGNICTTHLFPRLLFVNHRNGRGEQPAEGTLAALTWVRIKLSMSVHHTATPPHGKCKG